jgi:hypothetical protein
MDPTYLTGLRIDEKGEVVPETTTLEALKLRLSSVYGKFPEEREGVIVVHNDPSKHVKTFEATVALAGSDLSAKDMVALVGLPDPAELATLSWDVPKPSALHLLAGLPEAPGRSKKVEGVTVLEKLLYDGPPRPKAVSKKPKEKKAHRRPASPSPLLQKLMRNTI